MPEILPFGKDGEPVYGGHLPGKVAKPAWLRPPIGQDEWGWGSVGFYLQAVVLNF